MNTEAKNLNKLLVNTIQKYVKRIIYYDQAGLSIMSAKLVKYSEIKQCHPPYKRAKEE